MSDPTAWSRAKVGVTVQFVSDADALRWLRTALDAAAAPDLLTRDEKVSLRTAVNCLAEDYPHAAGLPQDTDEP